ncbi:MAG: ABC transporter permease [Syntrophales bacterium]|nr:ABC transporter permease [Syntrophales bacterium]MDD5642993.1 ABC transporter permease [Syntrophales bacterium]
MLAIALGTAGFITIITMGRDLKQNFNRDLELLGRATLVKVYFERLPAYFHQNFTSATVQALRKMQGVRDASLAVCTYMAQSSNNGVAHNFSLFGVDNAFWDVCGFTTQDGRLTSLADNDLRQRVVVLGPELAQTLFGRKDVVGKKLEIQQDIYTVVGVLKNVGLGDLSHFAFMPFTTAQDRILRISPANRIYLRTLTWDDVDKVAPLIPQVIQSVQYAPGLKVEVAWDQVKRVKAVAFWVQLFIYSSIVATLILGGVGIWTVMMAAVRTRTREIGLKKAMGAEDQAIMAQFLAEAVCLSFTASLAGSFVGLLTVEVTSHLISSHPPQGLFLFCVILGLVVAVGLGVAAGLYPSLQASRMEVVSAIRYE